MKHWYLKSITKLIAISLVAISLLALSMPQINAAIQLNPDFKPDNLPDNIEYGTGEDAGEVYINGIKVSDTVAEDKLKENPEIMLTQSLILYVGSLINRVMLFAATLTIAFLFVAAFNYISAFGKDEKIEKGKRGIFWAIMGLMFLLFSYAIVQAVIGALLRFDITAT